MSGHVSFFQTRYVTLLSNISAAHRGSDNPKKRVSEEIPDKKGTFITTETGEYSHQGEYVAGTGLLANTSASAATKVLG